MRKIAALFILSCVISASLAHASVKQNSFVPPKGNTLLIIGQDGNTIDAYVDKTGNKPAGVMIYTSVQKMEGLVSSIDIGAGPQYGNDLLEKHPWGVVQIGLYMVDALTDITTGMYDQNLLILANWLKQANRPVYLRIGYEFDNPENRYEPKAYAKAFIYIVDYLRKNNVKNAAYVWHSYTAAKKPYPWEDYYPGDDYVDWFGSSIFSTGNLPYAAEFIAYAKRQHKPFMIAESTPSGMFTVHGKKDWFNHVFRFIEQNNVEAFCYINSNWDELPMYKGQGWGDARVQKDPMILKLWLEAIHKRRYLKSSSSLFYTLGWRN